MRKKIVIVLLLAICLAFLGWSAALSAARSESTAATTTEGSTDPLATLAQTVLHGDPDAAREAAASLRQEGPAGMEALLALADTCRNGSCGAAAEELVDQVCGVRDCRAIRLFWYTDLEAAEAAARATGKPILSLRLMGRLDEELSCANSRFFRTVYYKNRRINQILGEQFILHWRSVRPVPRVTIDFGDGSHLERTLTGNSIHYVLDSRGRLIDALPGLSGPEAFWNDLERAELAARRAASLSDPELAAWAAGYSERRLQDRSQDYFRDLGTLQAKDRKPGGAPERAVPETLYTSVPLATGSKMRGEIPLLMAFEAVTDETLRNLAEIRRPRVRLDLASRDFLLDKQGVNGSVEAERLVNSFEETVALDEVINEYRTGPAILEKLKDPAIRENLELEAFNEWVYTDVFRTPLSDPWLGLAPADVYSALPPSTRVAASEPE